MYCRKTNVWSLSRHMPVKYGVAIWRRGQSLHLTFCQGENEISVAKERIRAYLCSIILYLYKKKSNHSIFLYLCREYY